MEHDELLGLKRQIEIGEDYRKRAKAMTDEWIARHLGISHNAVRKCKRQDGKQHKMYPLVAPYLSSRDRYKSKAHEYSREKVAKRNGITVAELDHILDCN